MERYIAQEEPKDAQGRQERARSLVKGIPKRGAEAACAVSQLLVTRFSLFSGRCF